MSFIPSPYSVEKIDFNCLKDYWLKSNHFAGTDSKMGEYVSRLGPFQSDYQEPPYQAFGLFYNGNIAGVTQIVLWNQQWVRYRTLNVAPEHRGKNIGLRLLLEAHSRSWNEHDIFGWVRRSHLDWSLRAGFVPIDHSWHDSHIAMLLPKEKIFSYGQ